MSIESEIEELMDDMASLNIGEKRKIRRFFPSMEYGIGEEGEEIYWCVMALDDHGEEWPVKAFDTKKAAQAECDLANAYLD